MSVGLPFVMHFGSKPISVAGAFVLSPWSTRAFPEVRRKSGFVPSGPARVAEVLLLAGMVGTPLSLVQADVGSWVDPLPIPTLLIIGQTRRSPRTALSECLTRPGESSGPGAGARRACLRPVDCRPT